MCQYFSCIVTRDFKVHWSKKSCSHEDLIAELKLADTKLVDRDFVRIEITPKSMENLTRNPSDWVYIVDEEGTVPAWYKKEKQKAEEAVWLSWAESVKVNLVLDAESVDVTDTYLLVRSSSTVTARDSSTVTAWDSSTVDARDSSTVDARDSSTVTAWGSSTVDAWGSSTVDARGSSTVDARGSSTVEISSDTAVVLCHGKIYVNEQATVIVQDKVNAAEV
jgi:hypothetical protein